MGHLYFKSLRILSHLSDGIVLDNDPTKLWKVPLPLFQAFSIMPFSFPFPNQLSLHPNLGGILVNFRTYPMIVRSRLL